MNKIYIWDTPLIALLSIIKEKIESEDYVGAQNTLDGLIIKLEGCYEGK
jgi:hypothetical protein